MLEDWYIMSTFNKATEDGGEGRLTNSPSQGRLIEAQLDEAGIEQGLQKERLKIKACYFENHITDLIYSVTDPDNPKLIKKMNAARGKTRGVEIGVDHRFNRYISLFANLSYTDPRIIENRGLPETEGRQVSYVPAEIHSLGIDLNAERFKGGISGQYMGKRYTEDDNSDTVEGVYGSYDSHFVVDTRCSLSVVPELTFFLGIDNIFDREYYEHFIAPGRTLRFGLEARF